MVPNRAHLCTYLPGAPLSLPATIFISLLLDLLFDLLSQLRVARFPFTRWHDGWMDGFTTAALACSIRFGTVVTRG